MNEAFEGHSEQEGENFPLFHSQEVKESVPHQWQDSFGERQKVELDPPRQIPNRSYSLQPDMAGGWRPRRSHKANFSNVFSINYNSDIVDAIVKELYKAKGKNKDKLVYLGPRRNNSYLLHEERSYPNPYPIDKKVGEIFSGRNGMPHHPKVQTSMLTFDSDFESGNLDAAVERGPCGFDLFMRVDSNTRGHTNWFYFSVSNSDFIGTARFSICNFRRQKSLYQRGLKPYVFSRELDSDWRQGGKNVSYERQRPRYAFLYEDQEYEEYILNTYFTMSFSFDFTTPNDTVMFAYSIPYTYSKMLKMVSYLTNAKTLPPLKSLSGLQIPVLEVTDETQPEYNKQVVLVTARIHPGQANSSFVAEGLLEYLCGNEGKQLRKSFIFVVVPMVNPDGVVAGNYRTSLFGKDLNRTFDQSRKYAFPETFHLVQLANQLKLTHKRRFNLYLDLHGHSVKKNVFMYGPDFSIQHSNYDLSRQLPRILGSLTSLFRYYSCIFRISSGKATTSRAILNRKIDIPFTYTMESSNGFYYDAATKAQMPFSWKKYKEMGVYLCKALGFLGFDQKNRIRRGTVKDIVKDGYREDSQRNSDDDISQGKSDSEPEEEDMTEQELQLLEKSIQGRAEEGIRSQKYVDSPEKSAGLHKFDSRELRKKDRHNVYLPPINSLNRAVIFSNRSKKKDAIRHERLQNIESQAEGLHQKLRKPRYSISQIVTDYKDREQLKGRSGAGKETVSHMFTKFRISK